MPAGFAPWRTHTRSRAGGTAGWGGVGGGGPPRVRWSARKSPLRCPPCIPPLTHPNKGGVTGRGGAARRGCTPWLCWAASKSPHGMATRHPPLPTHTPRGGVAGKGGAGGRGGDPQWAIWSASDKPVGCPPPPLPSMPAGGVVERGGARVGRGWGDPPRVRVSSSEPSQGYSPDNPQSTKRKPGCPGEDPQKSTPKKILHQVL